MAKKIISIALSLICIITCVSFAAAVNTPEGYVTVSFEDFGVRVEGDEGDYPEQLGVLVAPIEVPFYENDSIADVTLRALDDAGIGYTYTGTVESGFYLSTIKNFYCKALDETVEEFGEFYSGCMSGWMITLNNWFINMGASEFDVEDGDIIRWQNTCQYGTDIGCDWSNPSAEITGLKIASEYGTLTPEFNAETENYVLNVPYNVNSIKVEALQENYWSTLTYRVNDTYYKLLRAIPVTDGTQIIIECAFSEYAGQTPTATDKVIITIAKEEEPTTAEPTTVEPTTLEPTTLEPATAEPTTGESGNDNVITRIFAKIQLFFKNIFDWFKNLFK